MYIPNHFNMGDTSNCQRFIKKFGFGILISNSLTGSHLPFVLKTNEGENGTLYAHCARANKHWKELDNEKVLIIFSGPHAYISPSWYSQSPAVPTWNYTTVHVYGKVTLLNAKESLSAIDDVVKQYEPSLLNHKNIVTDDYKHKLLGGLVAFKIEITQLEGQLKLGQQKKEEDQLGVFNALSTSNNLGDKALANYMREINIGT